MSEILKVMSENPDSELIITASHGAYIRDGTKGFLAGPFEDYEYGPLIDEGELIEAEACSIFKLNTKGR